MAKIPILSSKDIFRILLKIGFEYAPKRDKGVVERLRESEIWQYRLENEGRVAIERTFYEGVFLMATNYYIREIIAGGLNQAVAERDGQISGLNQAVAERDVESGLPGIGNACPG